MFLDFVNLKTDIIAVRPFRSLWSSITRAGHDFPSDSIFWHNLRTDKAQFGHNLGTA